MEDWKERLIAEHSELKEKLQKLIDFINSEKFYKLNNNHKKVLSSQKLIMEMYLQCLSTRLFENLDDCFTTVPDYNMLICMSGLLSSSYKTNLPDISSIVSPINSGEGNVNSDIKA